MNTPESLWDFAVRLYGNERVRRACLRLQDQFGIDVNWVLYAAWLGRVHGFALSAAGLESALAATTEWNAQVVQRLRQVRRALAAPRLADHAEQGVLLQGVKDLELHAEQAELQMLERLPHEQQPSDGASSERAILNVRQYLQAAGVQGHQGHELSDAIRSARTT